MDQPKIVSRIIVQHEKDCWAKGNKHEWSGIPDKHNPYYFGTYTAKKNPAGRGNYHIWIRIVCNNPNCPAIKAVHSSVLINA